MLDQWTIARRCRRCGERLSEEDEGLEDLCFACFAQHPPCLKCYGSGIVWRRGVDRRGVPVNFLAACPACA